jgi:hypothetical protein
MGLSRVSRRALSSIAAMAVSPVPYMSGATCP